MNECPWCGRKNLNVYAYCQTCGRGLSGPESKAPVKASGKPRKLPFPLSMFVN